MWDRKDLKQKGKKAFLKNYWLCVLVAFLVGLLINITDFEINWNHTMTVYEISLTESVNALALQYQNLPITFLVDASVVRKIFVISVILDIFILNIIEIGGCRFFIKNRKSQAQGTDLIFGFQQNYFHLVGIQFLVNLFIFLWSLLFIIPGIVKSYEYCMVRFLLAENPEMSMQEAFQQSKAMMYGHKMDAFILDLSFIGWNILSAVTFGLVGLFYSSPYQYATQAELYNVLKENQMLIGNNENKQ